jgi:hypothetical protein
VTDRLNRRRLLQWLGIGSIAATTQGEAAVAPVAREPVRVLFTRVNSERYYDAATAFPFLAPDQVVTLRREPANPYDRRAIEVLDGDGRKLGYVARIDNSAVARMMDAGERFEAKVARLTAPDDIRLVVNWLPA